MFSGLFGRSSDVEKQLEDVYASMFQTQGMPSSKARDSARDLLKQAKQESLAEGTSDLPQNYGDILLQRESTDHKTKLFLAKRRKEGVRDADIIWWWNMHDLKRRMMLKVDESSIMGLVIHQLDKGITMDAALEAVRKYHPIYGDPDDTSKTTGEDRPLPYELKDRVNVYLEKTRTDPQGLKRKVESSTTFNALVRKEIRSGRL